MLVPMVTSYISFNFSSQSAPVPKKRTRSSGFGGMVGQPDVDQILAGYRRGFCLFSHLGPPKWLYNKYRMVLFFDEARCEKHIRRFLRNNKFDVTFDKSFSEVLDACAAPRPGKLPLTWITPKIKKLFLQLHHAGNAHSVEVWDKDGRLVGGLFGISTGKIFFTESQFHLVSDASKVAFAVLNWHLAHWGYAMNDGKDWTPYLNAHGFRLLDNDDFLEIMRQHADGQAPNEHWKLDDDIQLQGWQGEFECSYPGEELAAFKKDIRTNYPIGGGYQMVEITSGQMVDTPAHGFYGAPIIENKQNFVLVIWLASFAVIALGIVREIFIAYIGVDSPLQDLRHFALDSENSLPVWYSSTLMTLSALLL